MLPSSFPHLFTSQDSLRCLIPCVIDQDPYFRLARDVAPKIGYQKPALIDDPNSAIYVTDSADDIEYKISKHAVSGGQKSMKLHKQYGANLKTDISFKKKYGSGNMFTGHIKKRLTEVLTQLVEKHRKARAAVTDRMVDAFMAMRPLGNMFD
ncbi:hypothetical protein MKX01_040018 [Papaver californicum]|nr:hypothetical protein MKX01_040018 [Papaver californicum]